MRDARWAMVYRKIIPRNSRGEPILFVLFSRSSTRCQSSFSPPDRHSEPDGVQELGGREDVAEVEVAEDGVLRRTLVEPHRVHDVLEVRRVPPPEGDSPLPVIQAGRRGDDLADLPSEL